VAIHDQLVNENCALYLGDCVEVMRSLPDSSMCLSVFSPPFANLYSYSNDDRDLGNSLGYDEFFRHFGFVVQDLLRLMIPGRSVVVHCIDIPAMKERDGYIGLKDFPGDLIRLFQTTGFIYHSRTVVWKDPLIEAVRTKAIGLAHKTIVKDSAMCRAGLPDYVLAFRKPGENPYPIQHPDGLHDYAGSHDPGGVGVKRSHNIWRRYASPIWMDIRQTHTLNFRDARDPEDEKHICPLQLDVIDRCLILWSNPGENVLTPFAGVGSEVYGAVLAGRRGIGIELKPSYYRQMVKNVESALAIRPEQTALFATHGGTK
jgi:DNA modification methylase